MYFEHSDLVWQLHPGLNALTVILGGVLEMRGGEDLAREWLARTEQCLACGSESAMPEVAPWRDAFGKMGLKRGQYRCAAEALLRRYRKEKTLPAIHPLVDLLNAVWMAYAIPIAVFDCARIASGISVHLANGSEVYETFQGDRENTSANELIFSDEAGSAHLRRWTHRESARCAVRAETANALIVAEALHDQARAHIACLEHEFLPQLRDAGLTRSHVMKLDTGRRRLEF